MDVLRLHLVLVATWGGLVGAEAVLELALGNPPDKRAAAVAHFWIDVLLELPLVAGVTATGVLLAIRLWPPSPLVAVKLVVSTAVVVAALLCAAMVVERYRHRAESELVDRYRRRILSTGAAIPLGVAGAVIGLLACRSPGPACVRYERDGAAGLVSRQRGRPSNHRLPDELRDRAVGIVRDQHADFGPQMAQEKLVELHDLRVGRETLRKWMAAAGIWTTRRDRPVSGTSISHGIGATASASSSRSTAATTSGSRPQRCASRTLKRNTARSCPDSDKV